MVAELMHFFDSISKYDTSDFSNGLIKEDHLYTSISVSFLEGFINYVDIISAFLLERYEKIDLETVEEAKKSFHTKIADFEDDVILLARSKSDKEIIWFFWFDCDVSDCQIGRFKTKRNDEELKQMLERYVKGFIQGKLEDRQENCDLITGYLELPVGSFSGWISWD